MSFNTGVLSLIPFGLFLLTAVLSTALLAACYFDYKEPQVELRGGALTVKSLDGQLGMIDKQIQSLEPCKQSLDDAILKRINEERDGPLNSSFSSFSSDSDSDDETQSFDKPIHKFNTPEAPQAKEEKASLPPRKAPYFPQFDEVKPKNGEKLMKALKGLKDAKKKQSVEHGKPQVRPQFFRTNAKTQFKPCSYGRGIRTVRH